MTANGTLIFLMGFLFLFFGYLGVPVAFALIASVLIVAIFTPISLASMMAQLFNGMDVEALLAVPFFLLVGDLMTSAKVTVRMIRLSQTMVGHLRGGLAQVVTLFSMFFAGISGSSAADVAVLTRTLGPEMNREGYDKGFTAALIASAATMANLIPPSIMAVVYGATGNVSIGGLFLAGIVPGVLVGIGLMIYSYFFGPVGLKHKRATFGQFSTAAKEAVVPLMIPVIIMGGILTGKFTPTEAGVIAVAYIVFVAIPFLNYRHIDQLPRDMALTGLLYSIPLITIGAASMFGWMLAYLRGPAVVSEWIANAAGNDPIKIMLLLVALFVIVGDFIDAIPAIIIFMPIITDLSKNADVNPVHMGVVIIVTLAFGLITPPYGLCLLMASKFIGVRFGTAMFASLPIYIIFFAAIAFSIFFPDIVLWLPKHLLPQSVGCFKNPSGTGYHLPLRPQRAGESPVHEIRAFQPCLGQARHDAAPALRGAVARARRSATRSASITASASSITSVPTKAGFPRPASTRSAPARAPSACASAPWATSCRSIIRCGSPRRSPSSIRCSAGAWNAASSPASTPDYFRPFGLDYGQRKSPTLEFVDYLRAAYRRDAAFTLHGRKLPYRRADGLAVQPVQKPHPPLWMMSRDPQTLEFCARERHQSRLFPDLSAQGRGAALPQIPRRLEQGRHAAQAEHRLLHRRLCRRDRREGARRRAGARGPRL